MIVFGCAVTQPEQYSRWAARGIELAREPDSAVYPNSSPGSIFRAYNALLDLAAGHDELEALVLVHQDVEIVDPRFCAKVRKALSDPEVGVVGCVGALDTRSLAWWEGAVTWASFTHRYYEYGGGELPAFAMHPARAAPPAYARTGEVDTLDGFILVVAPWSVRNLRFDESLGMFHGYDLDFCLQVRDAGRKVLTADLKVVHHHSLKLLSDPENWIEANIRLTQKWEARFPQIGAEVGHRSADWKARARRAESTASANNTLRIAAQMEADARARELQREIEIMRASTSWRVTEPMRRVATWLRRGEVGRSRRS
jgi:hypothetical protein